MTTVCISTVLQGCNLRLQLKYFMQCKEAMYYQQSASNNRY